MNEIEKMYENAEVEKPQINYCTSDNCPFNWKYGICQTKNCPNWATKQSEYYPPFTAEKQIELIKWLAKHYGNIHILNNAARGFAIGIEGVSFNLKKFEEIIAMVLNTFWQDLTDQDKEEIRRILNE